MDDIRNIPLPPALKAIEAATQARGFTLASDVLTGLLLRTLAASKPAGTFLELGTGTGMGAAWILDGMDADSRLFTVDQDAGVASIARSHLGEDSRAAFHVMDGAVFLRLMRAQERLFDLIFADTWPGKYTHLDDALQLLKVGGVYVVDDMLAQPSWPDDHPPKVANLISVLEARDDLRIVKLSWSTGLIVAAKVGGIEVLKQGC